MDAAHGEGPDEGPLDAWRVHDTGLVALPSRFRRLGGIVRHHRGAGEAWPAQVTLVVADGELRVTAGGVALGSWPTGEVTARRMGDGPPLSFVLEVPGSTHLLAVAAGPAADRLLTALS